MSDDTAQRFRVGVGELAGQQLVVLSDLEAETQAQLVPGLGFACIAFRVAVGDEIWPVLVEPPDAQHLVERTSRYGIPILFPWPNRVRGGRFTFGVTEYRLPTPSETGNASHGLVRERPWLVEATGADVNGAFCRASVTLGDLTDDPWPFLCRLTVEYRLHGQTLSLHATATNTGDVPMPMGFGLHPWFNVPFTPDGSRAAHELLIASDEIWELESNLPTGEILNAYAVFDAQDWRPLQDVLLDEVYTSLDLEDGWFTAAIRDPSSGRQISVRSDDAFREHVVYAPLHLAAVCLEPYTCATDAFNLAARGLHAGMIVLEPGASWSGRVVIEARV